MIPENIVRSGERSILKLTLYSRPGCHLCDDMVAELADHLTDCPYELEIVNIDSDPELQSRYAGRIPLLMQDNVLVAEYVLDRDHLAALAGNRNFK